MTPEEAYNVISSNLRMDVGRFYGSAHHLSVGTGVLYKGVRYPVYNEQTDLFRTVRGLVYVLTHECDVSQQNLRPFNDDVILCPVIPFIDFVHIFKSRFSPDRLSQFLISMAQRKVSRLMYWPPLSGHLEYGGIVFFNQVCSTKLMAFQQVDAEKVGALSAFGLFEVDMMFRNHFFRPKAESLSFSLH